MADGAPASAKQEKPPLLERVGVTYFQSRSQRRKHDVADDAVHELNEHERKGLMRVERGAIFRACLAGALSAGASAVAEVWAEPLMPEGTPLLSKAALTYWAILGGVTAGAAVIEIAFLYWDTLRSVHELSAVAGLALFGPERTASDKATANALARAALELPNPITTAYRVNPRREASATLLLLASLAYKAKVGVTNFLLKLFVRRVAARALARSALNAVVPFVAVPVTAVWNGAVSWMVMREARLRTMGPSAAHALVDLAFAEAPSLSDAGRLAALRAVAAAIVRTQDLHPNLVCVLEHVRELAGDTGNEELDDVGAFLQSLSTLSPQELGVAMKVLAIACIVDGRLTRKEVRLFTDALVAAGRSVELGALQRLRHAFASGKGVDAEALRAI